MRKQFLAMLLLTRLEKIDRVILSLRLGASLSWDFSP
jgi:hypothetical protein